MSYDLESLISSMTMTGARQHSLEPDSEATNADDEGIEKDADGEDRCTVQGVIEVSGAQLTCAADSRITRVSVRGKDYNQCVVYSLWGSSLHSVEDKRVNCSVRSM